MKIETERYVVVLLLNKHGDLYIFFIILAYKLSPLKQKKN